ncbi:MAG TPA: EF-hand domain-containing protein [Rudaea sp.]|jgi:hypothetical protein|nr:EF-hand domain-containing protein [Rudaea sp.]
MKTNRMFVSLTVGIFAVAATASAQNSSTRMTDSNGNTVIVNSGQPAPASYGPAPPFEQLDANHDGSISRDEASAYIPLFNDFDYLAHHADKISRGQFERWNATQNRQ